MRGDESRVFVGTGVSPSDQMALGPEDAAEEHPGQGGLEGPGRMWLSRDAVASWARGF